jgi:hypothetical protein
MLIYALSRCGVAKFTRPLASGKESVSLAILQLLERALEEGVFLIFAVLMTDPPRAQ